MAYTESLFLLLMVAAFRRAGGHRAWAGVFFALTVLCRLQGLVLILPLGILMLRQDGWRPKVPLLWLPGPLAAAAFLGYIASVTGSTTAHLDAQQAWGRQGIGAPSPARPSGPTSPYQGALRDAPATVFLLVFARVDGCGQYVVTHPVHRPSCRAVLRP
jgi:hypothetical protein